jgi:hypothetical protein
MIHRNLLTMIFLLVFVNLSLYLIPSFAPSMKKEYIVPYQLWFSGLAILWAFLPQKKNLINKINK